MKAKVNEYYATCNSCGEVVTNGDFMSLSLERIDNGKLDNKAEVSQVLCVSCGDEIARLISTGQLLK